MLFSTTNSSKSKLVSTITFAADTVPDTVTSLGIIVCSVNTTSFSARSSRSAFETFVVTTFPVIEIFSNWPSRVVTASTFPLPIML